MGHDPHRLDHQYPADEPPLIDPPSIGRRIRTAIAWGSATFLGSFSLFASQGADKNFAAMPVSMLAEIIAFAIFVPKRS